MGFIRRRWTAREADEWGKEDWIAIILSASSYVLLSIGSALTFLLIPIGFIILGIGVVITFLMYWVIDPKLKTISAEYEKKQKAYLLQLEEIQKWEVEK